MQRDFETTAGTYDSHPEGAYFLCIPLILGSELGAGDAPVLLLPDRLCVDAARRVASVQSGDQGIWIRGQQAPPLLWDRLGKVGLGLARIGWGGWGTAVVPCLQVLLGTPLPQEGQDGKERLTGQFMTKTSWFVCLALFLSVLRSPGQ